MVKTFFKKKGGMWDLCQYNRLTVMKGKFMTYVMKQFLLLECGEKWFDLSKMLF